MTGRTTIDDLLSEALRGSRPCHTRAGAGRATRRRGSRRHHNSSPAAAQLRELGFEHATDVIGGVEDWLAAGLPVEQPG